MKFIEFSENSHRVHRQSLTTHLYVTLGGGDVQSGGARLGICLTGVGVRLAEGVRFYSPVDGVTGHVALFPLTS